MAYSILCMNDLNKLKVNDVNNTTKMKLDVLNMLHICHCQKTESEGRGQAGRLMVRRTQSVFSTTGRHWELSLNHPSLLR